MVRFARAEGSRGCNKRVLEEATPWSDLMPQPDNIKKKRKVAVTAVDNSDGGLVKEGKKKKKKSKVKEEAGSKDRKDGNITEKQMEAHEMTDDVEVKKGKEFEKEEKSSDVLQHEKLGENEKPKRKKKKKKDKENTSDPPKVEFVVNTKGHRVKVFKDGTERTWFDLPYEDNERMTRYDNMWVKREMAGKLDQLKETLKEQNLGEKQVMRKFMKAKRKAHRELRIELIYEQKRLVSEQQTDQGGGGGAASNHQTENKKNKKRKTKLDKTVEEEPTKIRKATKVENNDPIGEEEVSKDMIETNNDTVCESEKESHKNVNIPDNECVSEQQKEQNRTTHKKEKKRKKKLDRTPVEEEPTKIINDTELENNDSIKEEEKSKDMETNNDIREEEKNEDVMETNNDIVYRYENKTKLPDNTNHIIFSDSDSESTPSHNRQQTELSVGKETNMNHSVDINEYQSHSHIENRSFHQYGEGFSKGEKNVIPLEFQEDDFMTQYDGFWVKKDAVERLDNVKEEKRREIRSSRLDGTTEEELTAAEQILFQRAMKKEKRFENRKLVRELVKRGGGGGGKKQMKDRTRGLHRNSNDNSADQPSSNTEPESDEVVKFDGFFVKVAAAQRLTKLREKLVREGVSEEELRIIMQKERRKEERVLKTERKLVCLKCRQPGHMVSACPDLNKNDSGGQLDICYTCGSTEHTLRDCNLKREGSEFSHASCYICGESGHISRQCPDNPRGLYPNGGACRGCGSVEHLAKNCPDVQKEHEKETVRAEVLDGSQVEALDTLTSPQPDPDLNTKKKKKVKEVKF